jgi:hypothetical protein
VFHNQKNNFSNSLASEQPNIKCIFLFHLMTKGRQAKKIGAALFPDYRWYDKNAIFGHRHTWGFSVNAKGIVIKA